MRKATTGWICPDNVIEIVGNRLSPVGDSQTYFYYLDTSDQPVLVAQALNDRLISSWVDQLLSEDIDAWIISFNILLSLEETQQLFYSNMPN
jgi:hypothetical protein